MVIFVVGADYVSRAVFYRKGLYRTQKNYDIFAITETWCDDSHN